MEYEIGADESTSDAVKRAVSAVEGRDPDSLRPLEDVLEPEALDTLFGSQSNDAQRPGGRVSFVYSKCSVTVDNGEYLTLELIEPQPRSERN